MPTAPPKPCKQSGCGALTHDGYCGKHSAASDPTRYRGNANSRGYDWAWRKVRHQALQRDKYLCVECLKDERVTPAFDVDHIIPVRVAPELRLVLDNLQSLCRPHHRAKTERDKHLPSAGG